MQRFITGGVLGVAFLALALVMRFDPGDFAALDAAATAYAHHFESWQAIEPFVAFTAIGSTMGIILLLCIIGVLLRRTPGAYARIVAAVVGQSVSVTLVKHLIGRLRPNPTPWIGSIGSFSFPSGHAASSMALAASLTLVLLPRLERPLHRALIVTVSALFVLGVGMSRILLAAHYASDVLAGYLLGAFWAAFAFALFPLRAR